MYLKMYLYLLFFFFKFLITILSFIAALLAHVDLQTETQKKREHFIENLLTFNETNIMFSFRCILKIKDNFDK